jgi:hypothetical protein
VAASYTTALVAGVGDWVVTRRNQRLATARGGRDFIKNGDRWTLTRLHVDGSVTLTGQTHSGSVRVPATYVFGDLDLGYAATAHRARAPPSTPPTSWSATTTPGRPSTSRHPAPENAQPFTP